MLRIIALLAALSVAACAGPSDNDGKNNGWEFNNDNPDMGSDASNNRTDGGDPDGGPADGGGPDMLTGQSVEFRLVNNSGAPVFAYQTAGPNTGSCGTGSFLDVLENNDFQTLEWDCTMCACGEEQCTVCAFDCAPGVNPEQVQLGAGDVRSYTWDGLFRVRENSETGQCWTERPPQSDTLQAQFCWGHAFDSFAVGWGEISNVECQTVEFSPDDAVVQVEILPTAREDVRLEMVNTGMDNLYASIGFDSPCIVDEWLRLTQGDQDLTIAMPCGECTCNEVNADSMCPLPCPAACAAPTPELYEFPPGAMRLWDWNRAHFVRDEVDGVMCLDDRRVAGEVTATFCWATGFDEGSFSLVGEQCETVTFDPYVDTLVRHEVN